LTRTAVKEKDADIRRLFLLSAWISPRRDTIDAAGRLATSQATNEGAASLARRVSMEPLFHRFLSTRFPAAPLSAESRADLEGQSKLHAFRWHEIREALQAAVDALSRKGIRPILLKGVSHAGECYDPPHLRPMRDIDLLVEEEAVEASRCALEEAGFFQDRESHPPEKYEAHHHIPPLFHRPTGLCVEVHHHLMRLPPYFEGFPTLAEFWRGARESRLFPGGASVLEPTHQVLNTCIHITHGDTIGRRAQNLFDLARTVETHAAAIDWDRLIGYGASGDVARSLALPLLYLAREGLASAPPEALAEIRRLSRLRWWEIRLLTGLVNRYRIGAPPPWKLVSGRLSNILWRRLFQRGHAAARGFSALQDALRRPQARTLQQGDTETTERARSQSSAP
jgi:putative nucleotidyltransferase-like protein